MAKEDARRDDIKARLKIARARFKQQKDTSTAPLSRAGTATPHAASP
jgi:hypothetical protein